MKRIITLILCLVLTLSLFSGCNLGGGESTEGTTEGTTEVTQSPEEAAVFKVLMIGQSHAQDASWLLANVLKAEMPDQDFLVVDVYKSVYLDEHIENIKNNAPVYDYCENNNGTMTIRENFTINDAVKMEQWDLIMFNEGTWPQVDDQEHLDGDFQWFTEYLRENAAPGFMFAYNATWAQPVSKVLYSANRLKAPENFRKNFTDKFGGDRHKHFAKICDVITKYVETDEDYDFVFHSGTAIQYASEVLGVPEGDPLRQMDLYRDYTHLSDFGRLIVAYQIYAQIYGLEELTEVNLDVIPKDLRATANEKIFGDLQITQEHKNIIIQSVNYALKNPNVPPENPIREAPTLEPLS